jgi:phosphinothricin acetyltransferase
MNEIQIRTMNEDDWQQVAFIYKQGIDTGNATFQQEVPTWDEWDGGHLKSCRLIAEIGDKIAGWAALSAVSKRQVYSGVAEVSVYISNGYKGEGVGTILLKSLITASENENFWTLQVGIFPENTASLKIHENLGFRRVGRREKIGELNGIWRDTILLERRSSIIGVNN